jgi:hypothetical protein
MSMSKYFKLYKILFKSAVKYYSRIICLKYRRYITRWIGYFKEEKFQVFNKIPGMAVLFHIACSKYFEYSNYQITMQRSTSLSDDEAPSKPF